MASVKSGGGALGQGVQGPLKLKAFGLVDTQKGQHFANSSVKTKSQQPRKITLFSSHLIADFFVKKDA